MWHLSTAQEIIEIEHIVYRRLTDVFCQSNSKLHHELMNNKGFVLRRIHQTSDLGWIAQFTPINSYNDDNRYGVTSGSMTIHN